MSPASPNTALIATPKASLKFYWGPMDCGKSTLALQIDHNHSRQGRRGLVLTRLDRSFKPLVTTRIGLSAQAIEVEPHLDLTELVGSQPQRIDYVICDEVCFYTVEQIEQLADLVDENNVDVYAFGLASDFRSRLFPAAQRLIELADEVYRLQVEVLCWCGRPGQLNARIVGGVVVREGEQIVVGDTDDGGKDDGGKGTGDVRYQVLCRRHYRSGQLGG